MKIYKITEASDYLGELVGLTQTYISRIEKEEADPNSEQLRNFAKALGVTPAIFFEEPEKEYKARFLESIDDKNMRPVYANVPVWIWCGHNPHHLI